MTHASPELAPSRARGRVRHQGEVDRVPALRPRRCDYCAQPLGDVAKARHARFCSADCRKAWWTVARNRGAQLYQLLMIWRLNRGRKATRGAGMIGRISSMIDSWVRSDRFGGGE
ncbi:hypothetical protein ACOTTU_10875 [Roseobacter sp. EG26]|uniref:hypothetical protein n=1 Tax=Roseobacter sp. EG26 TaxID=3412477 RepID=UPI003CE48D20